MTMMGQLDWFLRTVRPSRRDFMAQAAAFGVAGAAASTMWSRSAKAAPSRGGDLKVGIGQGSTGDTLDPVGTGNVYVYVARWTAFNNLIELDSNKNPLPELAESWDVSSDATDWLFTLRRGVTFHNGKTLDADDVVYSINLHRGEDSPSPAKPLLSDVSDVTAEAPDKVRFRLSSSQAELPYILADYALCIVPAGHDDWANPVGTGGYLVESWEPGVTSLFTRNPDYWKPDRAWVDSIELLSITDVAARMSALQSGAVHAIDRIDPRLAALVAETEGLKVVSSKDQNYFNSLMRCDEGPFANNDIRLAFKYLLQRQQMVDALLGGFGTVGNDHCVPSSDPMFNHELPQRPYDPEKAVWHLQQAGEDSFAVDLYTSTAGHPEGVNAAVLMQEAAKGGGVDINVIRTPADGYWSDVWMQKPFCISIWGVRPTPAMQMNLAYRSGAPWNDTYFSDPQFDQLLDQVQVETDGERRKQIYWDLQEILSDNGGAGIFAFIHVNDGYSESVEGTQPDAVREMYGCRVGERVWLEN